MKHAPVHDYAVCNEDECYTEKVNLGSKSTKYVMVG